MALCGVALDIKEARDILRLDGTDNDGIIEALLISMSDYLYVTTGYRDNMFKPTPPLVKQCTRFLLQLWYNPGGANVEKLQRTIDNSLTALSVMVSSRDKSVYYNDSGYYDPTAGKAIENVMKGKSSPGN